MGKHTLKDICSSKGRAGSEAANQGSNPCMSTWNGN